jgi:hypothetical protein
LLHDQAQHLIKFKCGIQHTCDIVKGLQFVAFAFQCADTCIECFPFTLKGNMCWR